MPGLPFNPATGKVGSLPGKGGGGNAFPGIGHALNAAASFFAYAPPVPRVTVNAPVPTPIPVGAPVPATTPNQPIPRAPAPGRAVAF